MKTNRERILGLVIDRLCGELGQDEEAKLRDAVAAHPELAEEIEHLEDTWKALELLDAARPLGAREHATLIRKIFGRLNDSRKLSEAEIEMLAAAGRTDHQKNIGL